MSEADEDAQVEFLVDFWNALVKVRPEFGRLSLKDRRELRGTSIAGTALSIHGAIAVADSLWRNKQDPARRARRPQGHGRRRRPPRRLPQL